MYKEEQDQYEEGNIKLKMLQVAKSSSKRDHKKCQSI